MKITKVLLSECTANEIVFETEPPLKPEIITENNGGDDYGLCQLTERAGKLVITKEQVRVLRMSNWSKPVREELSERLSRIERALEQRPHAPATMPPPWAARIAKWFGVPAE